MNWFYCALLGLAALSPALWFLASISLRKTAPLILNDSAPKAINFYTAQLEEIKIQLQNDEITPEQYKNAQLEIQRRLLQQAHTQPPLKSQKGSLLGCFIIAGLIPIASLMLYAVNGTPSLPAFPLSEQIKKQESENHKAEQLIAVLKEKLNAIPAGSEKAFPVLVLLGQAELKTGHLKEAATTLTNALSLHFDPLLAAITAETITQENGHVTPYAVELFKKALKAAPDNAPWKEQAQRRINQIGQ
ncbi:c-type cytochrome biogenesis protein CcmI [Entomobacter blattae]|uniref:Uncharacterized protein n=1 Tax=Entomobacter blattae TaxID=2762277 RepID=A0A7H1NTH5_9PROT|nr:c-type cytochrome biogenesis protein CcmI [Entomobacter blattae]QNT79085.1 hypothetical protein JGUZn3_18710 [Entomobacter blattae]